MANRSTAHMVLLRRDGAWRARARTRPRRGRILPAVAGNATVEARGRGRAPAAGSTNAAPSSAHVCSGRCRTAMAGQGAPRAPAGAAHMSAKSWPPGSDRVGGAAGDVLSNRTARKAAMAEAMHALVKAYQRTSATVR